MNILKVLGLFVVLLAVVSCAGGEKPMEEVNNSAMNSTRATSTINQPADANAGKNVNFAKVSVIYFGFDKDSIVASEAQKLDMQANWLAANPKATVTIEGHTDYVGTSEYNLALGERRANATKEYLVKKGIAANRITTVSYGKDKPANKSNSSSARAENRRTVTVR